MARALKNCPLTMLFWSTLPFISHRDRIMSSSVSLVPRLLMLTQLSIDQNIAEPSTCILLWPRRIRIHWQHILRHSCPPRRGLNALTADSMAKQMCTTSGPQGFNSIRT